MKNKIKMVLVFVFVFVLGIFFFFSQSKDKEVFASLDTFASCLSESGAKMYGTKWCPYCKKEKESFGGSFRLINYVECTEDPKECTETEIKKLPTWIMGDGKKLEGLQGLEKLSLESGCILSSDN